MVHAHDIAFAVSVLSGLISLGLLTFAIRAYRRSQEGALAFVAGAFTVFAIKSFVVAYALRTGVVEHELLELIDAIGDLATIFFFLVPILWPARSQ